MEMLDDHWVTVQGEALCFEGHFQLEYEGGLLSPNPILMDG